MEKKWSRSFGRRLMMERLELMSTKRIAAKFKGK
jgi:hypothetical protein